MDCSRTKKLFYKMGIWTKIHEFWKRHTNDIILCCQFQVFENSGINLMADSQYNGQTRVQVLLDYIQERQMDIEDLGSIRRIKLEQCIQLCQFENDANQVRIYNNNIEKIFIKI